MLVKNPFQNKHSLKESRHCFPRSILVAVYHQGLSNIKGLRFDRVAILCVLYKQCETSRFKHIYNISFLRRSMRAFRTLHPLWMSLHKFLYTYHGRKRAGVCPVQGIKVTHTWDSMVRGWWRDFTWASFRAYLSPADHKSSTRQSR